MLNWKKWLTLAALVAVSFVLSMVLVSHVSFASQVQVCKKLKRSQHVVQTKDKRVNKKVFCSVKPRTGAVGDYVEIKNQYNYIVAIGRIVRHSRSSTIVVLKKYDREVGSMTGFPVMIRNNENQDYWTATTAPF
ncbi:hypothetical protein [Pseudobacteriovorax antillogorgiicola]|uniref:Uncharacterized protein n=1 Tax=Pseudobacteriovorax antillogorgiicola TaxID=1513793 RepID=A0A1Y6B9E7_9BACT|nr:hypothetical protein [Pseudobacteriovorax antillogorgiicola]TCS59122.1 hypothetical protein EDD56_10125 [Pseudobacteriovorax antillogorgiicola]SME91540.1 hypothetical protein SAMN06296036_101461 [Pseudobacteriovorax antillogorgiicola]